MTRTQRRSIVLTAALVAAGTALTIALAATPTQAGAARAAALKKPPAKKAIVLRGPRGLQGLRGLAGAQGAGGAAGATGQGGAAGAQGPPGGQGVAGASALAGPPSLYYTSCNITQANDYKNAKFCGSTTVTLPRPAVLRVDMRLQSAFTSVGSSGVYWTASPFLGCALTERLATTTDPLSSENSVIVQNTLVKAEYTQIFTDWGFLLRPPGNGKGPYRPLAAGDHTFDVYCFAVNGNPPANASKELFMFSSYALTPLAVA